MAMTMSTLEMVEKLRALGAVEVTIGDMRVRFSEPLPETYSGYSEAYPEPVDSGTAVAGTVSVDPDNVLYWSSTGGSL